MKKEKQIIGIFEKKINYFVHSIFYSSHARYDSLFKLWSSYLKFDLSITHEDVDTLMEKFKSYLIKILNMKINISIVDNMIYISDVEHFRIPFHFLSYNEIEVVKSLCDQSYYDKSSHKYGVTCYLNIKRKYLARKQFPKYIIYKIMRTELNLFSSFLYACYNDLNENKKKLFSKNQIIRTIYNLESILLDLYCDFIGKDKTVSGFIKILYISIVNRRKHNKFF